MRAFMFGAWGEPTIESRSVFSTMIVSTFVTGAGLADSEPHPVWSTAAGAAAAPAEPENQASNIAIAQTVVFMACPGPSPARVRGICSTPPAALPWSAAAACGRRHSHAEVHMPRFIIATAVLLAFPATALAVTSQQAQPPTISLTGAGGAAIC